MLDVFNIEDVAYGRCAYCLIWRPADELVWNNELLDFVCYDTRCVSAWVV